VRSGYTVTLGRAPTEQETTDAVQFIKDQTEAYKKDGKPDAERLALNRLVPGVDGVKRVYLCGLRKHRKK